MKKAPRPPSRGVWSHQQRDRDTKEHGELSGPRIDLTGIQRELARGGGGGGGRRSRQAV